MGSLPGLIVFLKPGVEEGSTDAQCDILGQDSYSASLHSVVYCTYQAAGGWGGGGEVEGGQA